MGKSTEEALLKRQQDFRDELAQLMESANNRLSFKSMNLAERYIQHGLKLVQKYRFLSCGCEFEVIMGTGLKFEPVGSQIYDGARTQCHPSVVGGGLQGTVDGIVDEMLSASGADCEYGAKESLQPSHFPCAHPAVYGGKKGVMLVFDVQIMEGDEQRSFASRVGFRIRQAINKVIDAPRIGLADKELFFQFRQGVFEFLPALPDWESDVSVPNATATLLLDFERGHHLIKWCPQIVHGIGGDVLKVKRDAIRGEAPDLHTISTHLNADFIRVSGNESPDLPFEILDVGFGPFDLAVRRRKGLVFHDPQSFLKPRP